MNSRLALTIAEILLLKIDSNLAVGDALGAAVEVKSLGAFAPAGERNRWNSDEMT
jgi:hypothetical protein